MDNSSNEDQFQRRSTNMEGSSGMTIEFLRARLLSERSVSRTARQRADELAERVAELEEQLNIVTLQRRKAEKATTDVLAILKSHGIGDFHEAFDSGSDQESTPCESEIRKVSIKEEHSNSKPRRKDMEASSGSELESSSVTGRSLSWKSGKHSPHSLEKKKYMDSARRRRMSFPSADSSSSKCVGKSCRQIKRREMRLSVALQIDHDAHSSKEDGTLNNLKDLLNGSNGPAESLWDSSENSAEKLLIEGPVSEALEKQKVADETYIVECGGNKDMERALERQAQLIGQYEAEEKAQREWEERFRDSCDPGNHSDVTEERDETKTPILIEEKLASDNQATNFRAKDCASKDSNDPNGCQSSARIDSKCIESQKFSNTCPRELNTPGFSRSDSKEHHHQEHPKTHQNPPYPKSCGKWSDGRMLPKHSHGDKAVSSFSSSGGVRLDKAEVLGSGKELAIIPGKASVELGSILGALEQAKLSLKEKLNKQSSVRGGCIGSAVEPLRPTRIEDRLDIPVGCAGLFRLPTDFQSEATTRTNVLGSNSQLSLESYSRTNARHKFFSGRGTASSRSGESQYGQYLTEPIMPYGPAVLNSNVDAGLPPSVRFFANPHSVSIPFPSMSSRTTYPTYPIYDDPTAHVVSDGGLSRPYSGRDVGLSYSSRVRPNVYR